MKHGQGRLPSQPVIRSASPPRLRSRVPAGTGCHAGRWCRAPGRLVPASRRSEGLARSPPTTHTHPGHHEQQDGCQAWPWRGFPGSRCGCGFQPRGSWWLVVCHQEQMGSFSLNCRPQEDTPEGSPEGTPTSPPGGLVCAAQGCCGRSPPVLETTDRWHCPPLRASQGPCPGSGRAADH